MLLLRLFSAIFAVVFCIGQSARAQTDQSRPLELIRPEKLQADFDEMTAIMQRHPARTVFTSEDEWNEIISLQRARLTSPMSLPQFFDVCAQVIHRLRCGHSGLSLPDEFFQKKDRPMFPLAVSIVNDSLIVRQEQYPFEAGASLSYINGKPFPEILARLKTYISADGFNTTWTIKRLNQSLNNYLSLYFNFPTEYEIVFTDLNDGKQKVITQHSLPFTTINRPSASREPLTYEAVKDKSTAVIGIRSFNYYRKDSVKFFRTVNDFFFNAQNDHIRNLVLDLRGNSGGDPFCAVHLLSYLENKPFLYYGETYEWCRSLSELIIPKTHRFHGDLYVLIDGMCFSTTGHLLSVMKLDSVGVMIGEESGGTYTCNDSGKWFELKHSKLRLRMATQTFKTVADELPRERGIVPDYEITPSSMDVINSKDTVFEYAMKLIEKNDRRLRDRKE
jgi:hypothetical protein